MEVKVTCPLGSECEEIKDNKIHRCRWYINVKGIHPQTKEEVDTWDCSMAWLPLLTIENAKTNRGQTQALESLRNEMIKGQNEFNTLLSDIAQKNREMKEIT